MLRIQAENLHSWRSLFRTARASTAVLLIAGVGLVLPSQTGDELIALSDMRFGPIPGVFRLQFALGALAVAAWYWARAALAARFGVDDSMEARAGLHVHRRAAFDAVPRIIFVCGVALGVFLLGRGFSWAQALSVAVWAVPGYLLIRWRLALIGSDSRSAGLDVSRLRSRRDPRQWLRLVPRRLHALLRLAPFGMWVSAPLLGVGIAAFVWGTVESYVPWARDHVGLPALVAQVFPGPSVALVGFALMIGPLTAIVFAADGLRIEGRFLGRGVGLSRPPVLTLLLLWAALAPLFFSLHTVRIVPPQADAVAPFAQRPSLTAFFRAWSAACAPDASQPVRPIVVAISGGGSRAGIWGAQVLAAVDAAASRRNAAVFAVSSVSGGSLGAAAYMTVKQATKPRCGQPSDAAAERLAKLNNADLGGDALGPLLAGALLTDTPRALLAPTAALVRLVAHVAPRGGDRAEALERAFQALWRRDLAKAGLLRAGFPEFSAPFLSLFYDHEAQLRPGMPIWIVNGTDVSTGERMLTAPFSAAHDGQWPFLAATDLLGILQADVPISTAINNGARFPYLEPAGELIPADIPGIAKKQLRGAWPEVVDGGYFDNEGMQTAFELAQWLRRQKIGAQDVRPILIQATADADIDLAVKANVVRCPDSPVDQPTKLPASPQTLQLLAPVVGLYNVRGAHSAVLLREVRDRYCENDGGAGENRAFFHFYLFDAPDRDIPLNWLLSPAIVRRIRAQLTFPPERRAAENGNDAEYDALRRRLSGNDGSNPAN